MLHASKFLPLLTKNRRKQKNSAVTLKMPIFDISDLKNVLSFTTLIYKTINRHTWKSAFEITKKRKLLNVRLTLLLYFIRTQSVYLNQARPDR